MGDNGIIAEQTAEAPKARYRTNADTERELKEHYRLGLSAADAHRALIDRYGANDWRVPSAREVRSRFRVWREAEDAESWDSMAATPGEMAAILPVLRELTWFSSGRVKALTRRTARHIARLREAFPDMPPGTAFSLASSYGEAEAAAQEPAVEASPAAPEVASLDLYLAYAPWRGPEGKARWLLATDIGVVPQEARAMVFWDWSFKPQTRDIWSSDDSELDTGWFPDAAWFKEQDASTPVATHRSRDSGEDEIPGVF